jgi:hypothetical protein
MLLDVASACVDQVKTCESSQPSQPEISVIGPIGESVSLLWGEWPQHMEVA